MKSSCNMCSHFVALKSVYRNIHALITVLVSEGIREIGERGAPDQRFVAFGLFLPIGLLMLFGAYLARPASPAAAVLALCIAAGYIGAALFPGDAGSPLSCSTRQALHNLAGAVEYIGGGFSLTVLAEDFGSVEREIAQRLAKRLVGREA